MKVLLHSCCAPCSIYCVSRLKEEGNEVHALFFNPNIHPYTEYLRRLEAMKQYSDRVSLPVIYGDYPFRDYIRQVVFQEDKRCRACYRMRLQHTAAVARRDNFDAFTTTLLYSKYQNHELIREVAENLAAEYQIPFHYLDFREGWRKGIEISKEMGLYRQQYCGCIYSEWERYRGKGTNAETG